VRARLLILILIIGHNNWLYDGFLFVRSTRQFHKHKQASKQAKQATQTAMAPTI